jgi:hypothetical protein
MLPKSANHCGIQPVLPRLLENEADFEAYKMLYIVIYLSN